MPAKLRLTLVKSPISHTARTRATVRALGLHRIGDSVEVADTPEMRGMERAVRFLLKTDQVEAAEAGAKDGAKSSRSRKTEEEETE